MNQNDLNEINNEYNEADKARSTARQAALEAWHEYDKRRADKDHAEVRFRQLSFCLMDAHRDGIPDDKRAKLEELRVEAEHAATAAEEARTVYMNIGI